MFKNTTTNISSLNMSAKSYCVVNLVEDYGNVEVLPTSWLIDSDRAKWPINRSVSQVSKMIKEGAELQKQFKIVKVKVYCYKSTFQKANKTAIVAQDNSHVVSDSSKDKVSLKWKRTLPSRYEDSSEEEVSLKRKRPVPSRFEDSSEEEVSFKIKRTRPSTTEDSTDDEFIQTTKKKFINQSYKVECVLQSMELFREELKKLNNTISELRTDIKILTANVGSDLLFEQNKLKLPDDIILPIASDYELVWLNSRLAGDENLTEVLANYLHTHSYGRKLRPFLCSIAKNLMTREVAMMYSRLGRKGKKSFEELKFLFNTILVAASLKFPVPPEEIAERFGKILATSADWDGGRKQNVESTFELAEV